MAALTVPAATPDGCVQGTAELWEERATVAPMRPSACPHCDSRKIEVYPITVEEVAVPIAYMVSCSNCGRTERVE